jgi:hypothetical protein
MFDWDSALLTACVIEAWLLLTIRRANVRLFKGI